MAPASHPEPTSHLSSVMFEDIFCAIPLDGNKTRAICIQVVLPQDK